MKRVPMPKNKVTPMPDMGTGGYSSGKGGKSNKPRSFEDESKKPITGPVAPPPAAGTTKVTGSMPPSEGSKPKPPVKPPKPNAPIGGPVAKPPSSTVKLPPGAEQAPIKNTVKPVYKSSTTKRRRKKNMMTGV